MKTSLLVLSFLFTFNATAQSLGLKQLQIQCIKNNKTAFELKNGVAYEANTKYKTEFFRNTDDVSEDEYKAEPPYFSVSKHPSLNNEHNDGEHTILDIWGLWSAIDYTAHYSVSIIKSGDEYVESLIVISEFDEYTSEGQVTSIPCDKIEHNL